MPGPRSLLSIVELEVAHRHRNIVTLNGDPASCHSLHSADPAPNLIINNVDNHIVVVVVDINIIIIILMTMIIFIIIIIIINVVIIERIIIITVHSQARTCT